MSLNHVVLGGVSPPLNAQFNNLTVDGDLSVSGDIQPYNFRGASFDPIGTNITNTSGGTGASITGGSHLSLQKIGPSVQGTYKCNFQTGTNSKGVLLTLILPGGGIFTNPSNLCVVATAFHQTGAGPWEQLYMSQANIISNVQIDVELVRPTDDTFSANKDYILNLSFSVQDTV
jgi:hypothetical protein